MTCTNSTAANFLPLHARAPSLKGMKVPRRGFARRGRDPVEGGLDEAAELHDEISEPRRPMSRARPSKVGVKGPGEMSPPSDRLVDGKPEARSVFVTSV